jgi:hypothetical protein
MRDDDLGQPGELAQPGMPDQQGELAGQQGASPFPDQYGQPGPGRYDPTDPDEYAREHGEGEADGEGGGPQPGDDPYGAHNPRTRETEERALDDFIEGEKR